MPEITPNQRFKHDKDTYEEGETYDVSPELAYYFTQCGWVGERGPGKDATLDVHDSTLGHISEVK